MLTECLLNVQARKVEVRAAAAEGDIVPFFDLIVQLLFVAVLGATVLGGPGGGEGVGGLLRKKFKVYEPGEGSEVSQSTHARYNDYN
jgi:hypothetical protein